MNRRLPLVCPCGLGRARSPPGPVLAGDARHAATRWGFVVPVINLLWPYQAVRDLFPPDDPRRSHVLRWFVLWLYGGYVSTILLFVSAALHGWAGWLILVIPAAQVALAALAARRVIAEVLDSHRALTLA